MASWWCKSHGPRRGHSSVHRRIETTRGHGRRRTCSRRHGLAGGLKERRWHGLTFDGDIVLLRLGGKHTLCLVSMSLSLAVFLVGILYAHILVHKILAVHVVDGIVAGIKTAVADETVSLAQPVVVSRHLGRCYQGAKAAKGIVQDLFVDHRIQVSDKELGTNLQGLLLVGRGLVDTQGLAVESNAIHDLGGIVGVDLSIKFHKAKSLVRLRDAIFR